MFRSRLLFCKEQREQFAHGHSFVKSDTVAFLKEQQEQIAPSCSLIWAILRWESEFPTLDFTISVYGSACKWMLIYLFHFRMLSLPKFSYSPVGKQRYLFIYIFLMPIKRYWKLFSCLFRTFFYNWSSLFILFVSSLGSGVMDVERGAVTSSEHRKASVLLVHKVNRCRLCQAREGCRHQLWEQEGRNAAGTQGK